MDSCRRFCRESPDGPTPGINHILSSVTRGDYDVSDLQRSQLFRPIEVDRLALPPEGFKQIDIVPLLPWPFDVLFSDEGLAKLRKTHAELNAGPMPRAKLHLADPEDYPKLLLRLEACGLVRFFPVADYAGEPSNGGFALMKSETKDRFVLNNIPGNYGSWGMEALQIHYSAILAAFPERARDLRLPARVMEISSPADLARLPSGGVAKSESDFSNYFYQFLAPRALWRTQCLRPVDAEAVGLPGGDQVRPVFVSLGMGHWAAALMAHLAHKTMMSGLVSRAVHWRLPRHMSAEHARDLATVRSRADASGSVLLAHVPGRMLRDFCRTAGVCMAALSLDWLETFRVPTTALELQPSADEDDPALGVSVHTHILGDAGFEGPLAFSRSLDVKGARIRFDLLTICYIDDNHQIVYPSRRRPALARSLATRVGDAGRLAFALVSAELGVEQNPSKLRWTSSDTTPSLGVEVEFVHGDPSWPMRCAVAPCKRRRDAQRLRAILAADGSHVTDELFDHCTGKFAWAVQPRRPFLSVLGSAYRERHASGRGTGPLWLSPAIREQLGLAADIYPFLESLSRPDADTMLVFDASGANAVGRGGYGVVSRAGVTTALSAEILGSTLGEPLRCAYPGGPRPRADQRRRRRVGTLPTYRITGNGSPPADTPAARAATDFLVQDWDDPDPEWTVEAEGEFRADPGHINVAEAEAGAMTVRAAIAKPRMSGRRVIIGGDNTASLHAFHKGRSSSWRVNAVCRRVAAMCYVADVYVAWFWLPSKANPADHPSRLWSTRRVLYPRPDVFRRRPTVRTDPDAANRGCIMGDGPRHPAAAPRHPFKGEKVHVDLATVGLAAHKFKGNTLSRYLTAWRGFATFYLHTEHQHADLALALEAYVQRAWETGFATKGDCNNLLCGVAFLRPELKARNTCGLAWQAIAGWSKLKPAKSWNPITRNTNLFLATVLARGGHVDAAVALVLAFHVYARGGEIDSLVDSDIALPGDPRLFGADVGAVLLFDPKAGRMQTVTVDDPLVIALLAFQQARNQHRRRPRGARGCSFFPDLARSGQRSLLGLFKQVQLDVGFPVPLWVRHSERHGGATHDYMGGRRAPADIAIRGRWASLKAMKTYLNGAQAMLLNLRYPQAVKFRLFMMGDPARALLAALGIRLMT
jgi:hypothetical protein